MRSASNASLVAKTSVEHCERTEGNVKGLALHARPGARRCLIDFSVHRDYIDGQHENIELRILDHDLIPKDANHSANNI